MAWYNKINNKKKPNTSWVHDIMLNKSDRVDTKVPSKSSQCNKRLGIDKNLELKFMSLVQGSKSHGIKVS